MPVLVANIGFGQAGAASECVREGWGPAEPHHRWTVGRESRVVLPIDTPGPDCILTIDASPWRDPSCLPAQTVMLAINGRLLATVQLNEHRTVAFALPGGLGGGEPTVLSICHLNSGSPRPVAGLDHAGQPLGLLVTRISIFRQPPSTLPQITRPALVGRIEDGSMLRVVAVETGASPDELMMQFENLGQNCEFGLVQRRFGAEPLGLLRFASCVTHLLVDGLMARFAGIGAADTTRIYLSDPPRPEFKVHDTRYYIWYSTGRTEAETTRQTVLSEQCRRLVFLQRKFVEDLRSGSKIFVLTRAEPLTHAEALAVFCALNIEGPNTLLWTVHGDPDRTGQVDRLMPGFLQGHLGTVDDRYYASWDAWLSVLANAALLHRSGLHAVSATPAATAFA